MDDEKYLVTDRLCAELGTRQHELTDPDTGRVRRFRFTKDGPEPCPRWAAVIFAKHPLDVDGEPLFAITDPDGNPFVVREDPKDRPLTLAPDEVVALLTELSQEALLKRVVAVDAKAKVNKSTSRADLIGILMARRDAMARKQAETSGDDELAEVELADEAA